MWFGQGSGGLPRDGGGSLRWSAQTNLPGRPDLRTTGLRSTDRPPARVGRMRASRDAKAFGAAAGRAVRRRYRRNLQRGSGVPLPGSRIRACQLHGSLQADDRRFRGHMRRIPIYQLRLGTDVQSGRCHERSARVQTQLTLHAIVSGCRVTTLRTTQRASSSTWSAGASRAWPVSRTARR